MTVWGIWLGHVYHWHIVTAALQMTMAHTLEEDHPVRELLDPMSSYLIGFNDFLLLTFAHIAPPTSVSHGLEWMELENTYAAGRRFHDDDPRPTLKRLGIAREDFTHSEPWDRFVLVRHLLKLWDATREYVAAYVEVKWPPPDPGAADTIVGDKALHEWLAASGAPDQGNVRGLPKLDDSETAREELIRLLTSYLYRITAHGCSRMDIAANPALSFVGNYPPTLQKKDLPEPGVEWTEKDLLAYLPKTGTIGSMINFLFTFVFSPPYESFIPSTGIDQELFFGPDKDDPLNQALIAYREKVREVIEEYAASAPTLSQWPRNIET